MPRIAIRAELLMQPPRDDRLDALLASRSGCLLCRVRDRDAEPPALVSQVCRSSGNRF